jgi:hypothetical protein
MRLLIAAFVLAAPACGSRSGLNEPGSTTRGNGTAMTTHPSTKTSGCPGATPALSAVLMGEPIDSFARPDRSGHQALVRLSISPEALRAIGLDASCRNLIRVAALEGWIGLAGQAVLDALDESTATAMASAYAEAIRTSDDAIAWNLPAEVTSSDVASHMIVLGTRALPHLRPLLDDLRALPYSGSETATVAELRHYRVADLAAGIIAVILGVPYQDANTPAERDRQLTELRAKI